MKHLGDITKINGALVPPVDIITGGSPCQDLSVAGKRVGLDGERSGLFMEQIRIIREMREATNGRYPRFMVWENVPGAFTSNGGEDFRAVLEETAKIADPDAIIPRPQNGKWTHSGCIMGDGWSIAWRVHDAQFWGVPQRRKRIALVANFGGGCAPEILFERKGMSWDITQSEKTWEDAAEDVIGCAGKAISFQERAGKPGGGKGILIQNERTGALSTLNNQMVCCLNDQGSRPSHRGDGYAESDVMYTLNAVEQHAVCVEPTMIEMTSTKNTIVEDGVSPTLTARMGTGGNQVNAVCVGNGQLNQVSMLEQANTLDTMHDQQAVMYTVSHGGFMVDADNSGMAHTLQATDYKDPQVVSYGIDRAAFNQGQNAKYDFSVEEEKIATQVAKGPGAVLPYEHNIVRRLTPLECERLQGFPDGWTDIGDWVDSKGKKHKGDADSPRYKALGNSIALPFWQWMAKRIVQCFSGSPSMASLFDGIGGFPLAFSRCGCVPVWASEIEEFPIAVTKMRFNSDE